LKQKLLFDFSSLASSLPHEYETPRKISCYRKIQSNNQSHAMKTGLRCYAFISSSYLFGDLETEKVYRVNKQTTHIFQIGHSIHRPAIWYDRLACQHINRDSMAQVADSNPRQNRHPRRGPRGPIPSLDQTNTPVFSEFPALRLRSSFCIFLCKSSLQGFIGITLHVTQNPKTSPRGSHHQSPHLKPVYKP